ncbi:MAG: hypothetical protein ACJA2S_004552 [Cyclobacteriaceae bacterium]|jgi:hypothetical protein
MPFIKGQPKKGGKTKGTKNEKTKAWNELGEFITTCGAQKAMDIINSYGEIVVKEDGTKGYRNSEKFLMHYTNLVEFFRPKQSRVESTVQSEEVTTIEFILPKGYEDRLQD